MMRGDQEEGFQITGGRKEERERPRTHLGERGEEKEEKECKPHLSPSLLATQSSPLR